MGKLFNRRSLQDDSEVGILKQKKILKFSQSLNMFVECGDQSFFINSARLLPAGKMIFSLEQLNLSKSSAYIDPHD